LAVNQHNDDIAAVEDTGVLEFLGSSSIGCRSRRVAGLDLLAKDAARTISHLPLIQREKG
jgi:hypothetical protein